jgi:hypothetical protein
VADHWCRKKKDVLFESLTWWCVFIWIKMMRNAWRNNNEGVRQGEKVLIDNLMKLDKLILRRCFWQHYNVYNLARNWFWWCNNPDFLHPFRDTLEIFGKLFLNKFHRNFYQNFGGASPIPGGPKLSTKSYYTANFISQPDPIILNLNPTHHHQHNTSYSITSYNSSSLNNNP